MTTKQFTVRMESQGGAKVKTDLAGIGEAGRAAHDKISQGAQGSGQATKKMTQEQARAARAFQQLKASIDPAYAAQLRYDKAVDQVQRATSLGIASKEEEKRVLAQLEAQHGQTIAAMQRGAAQTQTLGRVSGASSMQVANLGAQFNDIGVMLAAGQSPLQLAVQQGTQINQVFAQMGGGRAALRGVAAGFASMINPMSLATIGLIAGGAALFQWGRSALEARNETVDLEKMIDGLNAAVSDITSNNQTARQSLAQLRKEFGDNAEAVRDNARALRDLAAVKAVGALEETVRGLSGSVTDAIKQFEQLTSPSGRNAAMGDVYRERQMAALAEKVGFTADEAKRLGSAFDALAAVEGLPTAYAVAQSLYDEMVAVFGSAEAIPPELQEAAQRALEVANAGYDIEAALNASSGAAASASANAGLLAGQLSVSAAYAAQLAANLSAAPAGIQNFRNQAEQLTARIAALDAGYDKVSASAAGYRKELEQQYGLADAANAAEDAYISALINRQVKEFENVQRLNEQYSGKVAALNEVAGASGGVASAANAATKEFEKLNSQIQALEDSADPMRKFRREMEQLDVLLENGLSDGAYAQAVRDLNTELVESTPIISDVNSALGEMVDWMFDGFKDGMSGLLNIFTSTLKQMAAAALKNRITIGLGMSVAGAGGAAAAGQGGGILSSAGGLGNLMGGALGAIGGGSGLLGGASASIGTFLNGGLASGFGMIGSNIGTALAAPSLASISTAVGAALPVIGVGLAIAGLMKKTEVLVAEGVRARIDGAALELDSYEKTKTNNGFGMSSGFSRDFDRLDDAVQASVGARLSATIDALGALGLGTDLTGFSFSKRTEIKDGETFEGESEEVIREALDAAIGYLSDGALEMYQRTGEGLSDTLERLTTSFNGVNESLYLFGLNLLPVSLDGAAAASALLDLSGGLDAFAQKSGAVFTNMLTEQEQQARLSAVAMDQLNATFGDLNRSIPDTHAEFMALLDAQDLTTEAGRQTYSALLDVAQAFVTVNGTAQQAADAAQAAAGAIGQAASAARTWDIGRGSAVDEMASITGDALRDAEAALRAAFGAEADRVNAAYDQQIAAAQASANAATAQAEAAAQGAQETVRLRESVVDALRSAYRDRRVLDALGERQRLNSGTAFLQAALAAGGTSDLTGLQQALDAVSDPSTALFKSFAEYQQEFNVNTNLIKDLGDVSEGQLGIAQRTLNQLEDNARAVNRSASAQVDAITSARDAQLAALNAQMNALLGIDTSVMSVADAIAALKGAQSAASAAQDAASGGITSQFAEGSRLYNAQNVPGSLEYRINQMYRRELGRNVDAEGLDYWATNIAAGIDSLNVLDLELTKARMRGDTGIPAFEGGGFTGYGSRTGGLDGRGGFMAMLHPNETVIDHTRQSKSGTSSNAELVAEIKGLRDDFNSRIRYLQDKMKTLARIASDQDINGGPGTRPGAVVKVEGTGDENQIKTEEVV